MSLFSPPLSTQDVTTFGSTPASRAVSTHLPPRASLMATVSLALAVAGLVTVATGLLAAPGAVLGLLALLFALGGIRASRQRHIAGTTNATLGLVVGLVALVVGVLAVTGVFPFFDSATNNVTRLHDWLDAHASWATPGR